MDNQEIEKLEKNKTKNEIFYDLLNNSEIKKHMQELKKHDINTYTHSIRCGFLCYLMAKEYKYNENDTKTLVWGGFLHDIGKINTPIKILNKSGPLNKEEVKIIEKHPQDGFGILKNFSNDKVKEIALRHHEIKVHPKSIQPSSSNYITKPDHFVQIVGATDIFDALISKRSYKPKFNDEKIQEIFDLEYKGDKKHLETLFIIKEKIKNNLIF